MEVNIMDLGCSDHSNMCVALSTVKMKRNRPFRFLNCLASHREFCHIVQRCWNEPGYGDSMNSIWMKLKYVKNGLKNLNTRDSNNGFFFASMKNRVAYNHIRSLVNEQGELIQTKKAITEEILSYYKQLLRATISHLSCVSVELMRSRAVLNKQQQLILIEPVT
ncbi:hypothetical protein H5410_052532 [Solanum commersonii]|uniref:Uncharacterized protein n=1 Tax=Solanum commersonii TaxID=4109 RepID=A0A9J5X129_SOLCO|nr:hypothetical protein H5410_052532 [Solanum commersonii]